MMLRETAVSATAARPGRRRGLNPSGRRRTDHRRRMKACSKAALKRRQRAHLAASSAEIATAGRIDMVEAKKRHFEKAVARLDALLLDRPAAYLLRQQRALCFDALREIERGSPGARSIAMDTAALENFHL